MYQGVICLPFCVDISSNGTEEKEGKTVGAVARRLYECLLYSSIPFTHNEKEKKKRKKSSFS